MWVIADERDVGGIADERNTWGMVDEGDMKGLDNKCAKVSLMSSLLSSKSGSSNNKCCKVLLLDRSFDKITPHLSNFHYQSAIAQYLQWENNECFLGGGKIRLNFNDDFYQENKFQDLVTVGENIQKLIKNKTGNINSNSNCSGGEEEDMTVLETHLKIHNYVFSESMKNQELGELEIKVLMKSHKIMTG